MKGTALKSGKKKVSAKKLLKKEIAKQLKRKMRKLSRRAKKALAKRKRSKKARKKLFQSEMVKAIRSTVRQAEQVCKSLTKSARRRSSRVRCRFSDAERLVRRLEKSRSANNNRKLTKAVSGIMAAVASHMRPLVDVLYRQTAARRRTGVIRRRLRSTVAGVLRRLARQAFGFRRALDAVISDRKPSIQSKRVPPSSSSKTTKRLYTTISRLEAGKSKEGVIDTVARVISVTTQVFQSSVEDLLKVYRLRQITEKKLERAETSCDEPGARIDCINGRVFRVLERMVDQSSSLILRLNRALPTDSNAGKRKVPKAISVDSRLLKQTGGKSTSRGQVMRTSATRVVRVIVAVARNLRLVARRLKLAAVRSKLWKSAKSGTLTKDENKTLVQPPTPLDELISPSDKTKLSALAVRRVGGTMTLKSVNRVMAQALVSLEKWSRLLYWQTATNPDEVLPEPMIIGKLPATSERESAQEAARILTAIITRLRIVGERAGNTVRQKLAAGKKTTAAKSSSPEAENTGKKAKPQQKGAASVTQSAQPEKLPKKGSDASKKKPKSEEEKQKTDEGKKPKQKEATPKTKPKASEKKTATERPSPANKKPKATATTAAPKAAGPESSSGHEEPTEPEKPGRVINRDDMLAELQSQSQALEETVRGMASKVDEAMTSGKIQPENESDAASLWIRFMNQRLQNASSPTQKKKARLQGYFAPNFSFPTGQ